MSFSRRTAIAIAAAVFLVLAGIAVHAVAVPRAANTRSDIERYWLGRMQAVGVDQAKAELAADIADKSLTDAHNISHAFGGALYNFGGPLTDCPVTDTNDEFLSSGCNHEYIGRAISEHGLGVIKSIEESCATLAPSKFHLCEHGIGHGLIGYLGYSLENLKAAVDVCTQTGDNNCYRGAFMEYDFRRLVTGEINMRPPGSGEMEHSFCDGFSDHIRSVCIYWEPNWWYGVLLPDPSVKDVGVLPKLVTLCDQWKGLDNNLCLVGAGFNIFYLGVDVPAATKLCDTYFGDKSLFCKLGVAARYRTVGVDTNEVKKVCTGLTGKAMDQCMYAVEGHVEKLSDLPQRVMW